MFAGPTRRVLLLAILAWAAAACAAPTSARHGATSTTSAVPAGNCREAISESQLARPAPSVTQMFSVPTSGIVVGTIDGLAPSRYATADGQRPSKDESLDIVTPVKITTVARWSATQPAEVVVPGGTVGCDALADSGPRGVRAGTTALILTLPPAVAGMPGAAELAFAWEVKDGMVLIPDDWATVEPALNPVPVQIRWGDKTVGGSAVSLAVLRAFLAPLVR